MRDKLVGVCESAFGFAPSITLENSKALREIEPLSSEERALTGYTVDKVKIDSDSTDYFVEYSNNLERFMKDSGLEFHEAIEEICKNYDILDESVIIVVDESCINKLDLIALKDKYNVKRK